MIAATGQKIQREQCLVMLNLRYVCDIEKVWVWSFKKSGPKAGIWEPLVYRCVLSWVWCHWQIENPGKRPAKVFPTLRIWIMNVDSLTWTLQLCFPMGALRETLLILVLRIVGFLWATEYAFNFFPKVYFPLLYDCNIAKYNVFIFKFTIRWLLIYSPSYATIAAVNFRTFLSSPKETPYPLFHSFSLQNHIPWCGRTTLYPSISWWNLLSSRPAPSSGFSTQTTNVRHVCNLQFSGSYGFNKVKRNRWNQFWWGILTQHPKYYHLKG